MRCKACDSMIAHPVWNADLEDWELCPTCLDVINHVFEDPVVDDPYEEEVIEEIEEEGDYSCL